MKLTDDQQNPSALAALVFVAFALAVAAGGILLFAIGGWRALEIVGAAFVIVLVATFAWDMAKEMKR